MTRVLEKILQEIEKASYSTNTDYGHSVVVNMDDAARVICSHMEDEPVNNLDKLDGGWIPMKEKLPKESGTYIVSAKENDLEHVTFAKWQTRCKRWDLTGSRAYWKITAWKPLPAPYWPWED